MPAVAAVLDHGGAPGVVFEKLYPKSTLAAETWWSILRVMHPAESVRETVNRMPALLDKRLALSDGRVVLTAAIAQGGKPAARKAIAGCKVWPRRVTRQAWKSLRELMSERGPSSTPSAPGSSSATCSSSNGDSPRPPPPSRRLGKRMNGNRSDCG